MNQRLAVAALAIPLISFGPCFAQNAAPAPMQQNQPLRTTATPTGRSAASANVQLYKTEAEAKSHCGSDEVVWGNASSHVLHDPGTKYYGKTKHGGYVCKGMAVNAGYHESKE